MAVQKLPLYYGGPLKATTGTFSGAVSMTALTATTGAFSGILDLANDLEFSERTVSAFASNQDDVATGTTTVQRLSASSNPITISGFAGGRTGRVMIIVNVGASNSLELLHQNAGSVIANRIIGPNAATVAIFNGESVVLWYDNTSSRWRVISVAN